MDNLIPVNIVIGDRTYRIRVQPAHEEQLRATIREVNEQLVTFKTQFAGKDMQDYIAMVLIWLSTRQQTPAAGFTEASLQVIQRMHRQLDAALAGESDNLEGN